MRTAYYEATVHEFLAAEDVEVLGQLTRHSPGDVRQSQVLAWEQQISVLKGALKGLSGYILLEFTVPRVGSRIDALLISEHVLFVLEFKVGSARVDRSALNQAWDYALDLRNFHSESPALPIVPIVVATECSRTSLQVENPHADGVFNPVGTGPHGVRGLLDLALHTISGPPIDAQRWRRGFYRPTPTIIEAARALYQDHSVTDIARSDAGAVNLAMTSRSVLEIIERARIRKEKHIMFVTGVPGAGKTLVGLNIATLRGDKDEPTHAVYLSGNGPLVAVLREALTRDALQRAKASYVEGTGAVPTKNEAGQPVKAFIQNVHHFRDEGARHPEAPHGHVVIFDEAQRAWDRKMTADFMARKKGHPNFLMSEPEFLISYMDRHTSWSAIVCLVGSGQEINRGEAGISEWLRAIESRFPHWMAHASPTLLDLDGGVQPSIEALSQRNRFAAVPELHLAVSMRSFRAEHLSGFVSAALAGDVEQARRLYTHISASYPLAITRDIGAARDWVRKRARGTERTGLLASAAAYRLKPDAIDVRVKINPIHWFLGSPDDTRSSNFLEDAGTEFDVQGLELDWACVTWDADVRASRGHGWDFRRFRGNAWCQVKQAHTRQYMLNAYRVLLTRARQGMVIYVPTGSARDQTRQAAFYDPTFEYLRSLGLSEL